MPRDEEKITEMSLLAIARLPDPELKTWIRKHEKFLCGETKQAPKEPQLEADMFGAQKSFLNTIKDFPGKDASQAVCAWCKKFQSFLPEDRKTALEQLASCLRINDPEEALTDDEERLAFVVVLHAFLIVEAYQAEKRARQNRNRWNIAATVAVVVFVLGELSYGMGKYSSHHTTHQTLSALSKYECSMFAIFGVMLLACLVIRWCSSASTIQTRPPPGKEDSYIGIRDRIAKALGRADPESGYSWRFFKNTSKKPNSSPLPGACTPMTRGTEATESSDSLSSIEEGKVSPDEKQQTGRWEMCCL